MIWSHHGFGVPLFLGPPHLNFGEISPEKCRNVCPAVELAGGRESQDAAETSVWGKPITNKHGYLMKIHGDLLGLDGDLVRIPYLNILEHTWTIAWFSRNSAKWLKLFSLTALARLTAWLPFFSRRTCTAFALRSAIHFDMKTWYCEWNTWREQLRTTAESHVAQKKGLEKPWQILYCRRLQEIRAAGQRKGFAASCRCLWIFLDMVTSTSHWLLRAPLLTSFFFYVSVCQAVHGMGTSCFQVGSASYSAMTLWRQPAIAVWSWQTTQRSPTRRQMWIRVSIFEANMQIFLHRTPQHVPTNTIYMLHVWNIYQHLPHKWPKCR